MQERRFRGRGVEIAGAPKEVDVSDHRPARHKAAAEGFERIGHQKDERRDRHQHRAHERRRDQPAGAPSEECRVGKRAGFHFARDLARDDEAGDDEEHVDADEATRREVRPGMENDDEQHGERTQSVHVREVRKMLWIGGRRSREQAHLPHGSDNAKESIGAIVWHLHGT